jgi:hypothetical protein
MPASVDPDLEFRCPRCGQPATERFYGPCAACRQELVARFGTDEGAAEAGAAEAGVPAARFEPGMHVVPNHVATKD